MIEPHSRLTFKLIGIKASAVGGTLGVFSIGDNQAYCLSTQVDAYLFIPQMAYDTHYVSLHYKRCFLRIQSSLPSQLPQRLFVWVVPTLALAFTMIAVY
jgi:hypothetical protein